VALNPKRAAFVREYLIDLNATQAAIRAGYSPKTAGAQGHDLLKNPEIQAELEQALAQRAERVLVTAEDVIKGLRREAEGADSASARVAAWAHLGKHLGMFIDKTEHTGGMTIEVVYVDAPN
jgi:phage terminase small subunit